MHNGAVASTFRYPYDPAVLDCHAHLLPGIDDGPPDLAASLALCAALAAHGVRAAVATPHWDSPRFPAVRAAGVAAAWEELRGADPPLRLHLGAENHLAAGVRADDFAASARPLGEAALALVELPDDLLPPATWQALFALRRRGLRPVIAHPERCRALSRDDPGLADYLADGGLLQLTAASLIGDHGFRLRWRSRRLLARFPHACVIAGDTHLASGPRRPLWDRLPARWRAHVPADLDALAAWRGA